MDVYFSWFLAAWGMMDCPVLCCKLISICGSVCIYGLLRASELSLQLEWIFPCWLRVDSGWEDSEYILAPYRLDCRLLICINQLVHSTSPSGGLFLSLNKPHYLLHRYSPFFPLSFSRLLEHRNCPDEPGPSRGGQANFCHLCRYPRWKPEGSSCTQELSHQLPV